VAAPGHVSIERVPGRRTLLGITGAPASGKSTVAALVAAQHGGVVVPMDGFHLSDDRLRELGRLDRKGAPDTFDAAGYIDLLRLLRTPDATVFAPAFDRSREQTVPNAIEVAPDALVITEGNYLLLTEPPWSAVRPLLDACWFVEVPEAARVERLIARHVSYGWDPAAARLRATTGSDAANARLVAATRDRADVVVAG